MYTHTFCIYYLFYVSVIILTRHHPGPGGADGRHDDPDHKRDQPRHAALA